MFQKIKKNIVKYPIPAVIIVSLVFFASVLVLTAIGMNPKAKVEVLVAPASANITINGKSYKNGTYDLPKGEVYVKIEKDGFNTKEYKFNTAQNDKLYDYLLQKDGTWSWYLEHQDDALILNSIGDREAEEMSSSYLAKYPILEKLPIIVSEYDDNDNYIEFRIDGGKDENCDEDFCLIFTDSTGDNLDYAKEKIREIGFNPSNYQIIYTYTPITPLE